jgi:hypothetical protein
MSAVAGVQLPVSSRRAVKLALVVISAVAIAACIAAGVFAGLYFSDDSGAADSASACGDRAFGHISSLTRKGDTYELRFDPAWFLSGITANTAAAEDGVVEPGEPVPNDNYRVEEGHRLLTYLVSPTAKVTVLTRQGDPANFGSTPITVEQLAGLVDGEAPVKLFEPLDTGVWIRVDVDTVCAIDQQYQP